MTKRVYIETVGCQMNVLDSELIVSGLVQAGYELVDSPRDADTILYNTCSVRQHAEDKIYSALGRLRPLKERRPETIIGVLGCMAQKDQDLIFRRAGHVDLVVGPGQFNRLPEILAEVAAQRYREPRLEVSLDRMKERRSLVEESFAKFDPPRPPELRASPFQAMVRIMFGCDKFCTYCIVPKVRGPEQSRPAAEIVAEVRRLAADGCLEITLLGQTVNSYKDASEGRTLRLSDLLARLERDRRPAADQVRHELPAAHDRRPVASRPRPAQGLALSARARAERFERATEADEAGLHGRVLSRDGRADPLDRSRMRRSPATSSSASAARRRKISSSRSSSFAGPVSRTALFSSTANAPGRRPPAPCPTTCRTRSSGGGTTSYWPCRTPSAWRTTCPLAGQDVEVLVEGPSKAAQKRASRAHVPVVGDEVVQLVGRSRAGPYRGLRRPADACRADPAGADREGGCVYAVWTVRGFGY